MSDDLPIQDFQIGQRVQIDGHKQFTIELIYRERDDRLMYCPNHKHVGFPAHKITLAVERKPYEPTERRVMTRKMKVTPSLIGYVNAIYRPETDAEMGTRHTVERAEHDAQG